MYLSLVSHPPQLHCILVSVTTLCLQFYGMYKAMCKGAVDKYLIKDLFN